MVRGSRLGFQRLGCAGLVLGLACWALTGVADGQGFMVKPVRLEIAPRLGRTVDMQVSVRNTTNSAHTVLVSAGELAQSEEAGWVPLEAVKDKVDATRLRSCLAWMSFSPATLEVPPLENRPVTVRVKVPFGVHGTFSACLNIRTKAPEPEPGKIAIVVQFVIPLIVNVQGPPARENIGLMDVGLQYTEGSHELGATERKQASTEVYLQVNNEGETYARLGGKVGLMYETRGRWRLLANIPVRECSSIPGFAIKIAGDVKRRLPSGRYKILASLLINGRMKGRLEKEVDFEGDPSLTTIAADVTLDISPEEIAINGVPGRRQMTALSVRNVSDETVEVACAVVMPAKLRGVAMGSLTGEDFSCAQWVQMSPPSVTLRANQRRSFKIDVAIPREQVTQPNYYATLIVRARYPDGQSAGETEKMIWVQNRNVPSEAKAEPIRAAIASQEEDKYAVTAQFGNVGNIDFTPKASATLATAVGAVVTRLELETDAGRVLPLGTPNFSGVIDMAKVEAGPYLLTCTMEYADKTVSLTLALLVEDVEGRKVVTVLEKLPEQPGSTPSSAAEAPPAETPSQ